MLQQCCGIERNWSYTVLWLPLELVWTLDACWNPHTLTIETNFSFAKLFFSFGISTHFIVTRTILAFCALSLYPYSDQFFFWLFQFRFETHYSKMKIKHRPHLKWIKKIPTLPNDVIYLYWKVAFGMFAFFCFKDWYTGIHSSTATHRIIPIPPHFRLKFLEN